MVLRATVALPAYLDVDILPDLLEFVAVEVRRFCVARDMFVSRVLRMAVRVVEVGVTRCEVAVVVRAAVGFLVAVCLVRPASTDVRPTEVRSRVDTILLRDEDDDAVVLDFVFGVFVAVCRPVPWDVCVARRAVARTPLSLSFAIAS